MSMDHEYHAPRTPSESVVFEVCQYADVLDSCTEYQTCYFESHKRDDSTAVLKLVERDVNGDEDPASLTVIAEYAIREIGADTVLDQDGHMIATIKHGISH